MLQLSAFLELLDTRAAMLVTRLRYSTPTPLQPRQLRREWELLVALAALHERGYEVRPIPA